MSASTMRLTSLLGLVFLLTSVRAQNSIDAASTLIRTQVQDRYAKQSGENGTDVWKRPWRIVLLFNSSNAAINSAYTDTAVTTIRSFLKDRLNDDQTHKIWFYPYQLDLYSNVGQCLEAEEISPATLQKVEGLIPRVPIEYRSDGRTPYPPRGGHSNVGARRAALARVGLSSDPTLLIQITDVGIGEFPGSPQDSAIRKDDQRTGGLEGSNLVTWDALAPVETSQSNQTMQVFLYGPEDIAIRKTNALTWVFSLVGFVFLVSAFCWAVARFGWKSMPPAFSKKGQSWSVTVPSNGAIVLSKGERLAVYGPGVDVKNGELFAILRRDDVPSARLFDVEWRPKGIQIIDGIWSVTSSESNTAPLLQDSQEVTATDKTSNKTFRIKLEVGVVNRTQA